MSDPNIRQTNPLFFIHIPKAAGTTLFDAFRAVYGRANTFSSHDGRIESFKVRITHLSKRAKLIYGHFDFGLHRDLGLSPRYCTMMRDPVDRVVSLYYYSLQCSDHPHHHRAKGMDLKSFIEMNPGYCNQQTRFLSGVNPLKFSEEEMVGIAIENLESHFLAVGLTESFDESLIVFKSLLGWGKWPFYVSRNASQRKTLQELDPDLLAYIKEKNSADTLIYDFCKERLASDISKVLRCFPLKWLLEKPNLHLVQCCGTVHFQILAIPVFRATISLSAFYASSCSVKDTTPSAFLLD